MKIVLDPEGYPKANQGLVYHLLAAATAGHTMARLLLLVDGGVRGEQHFEARQGGGAPTPVLAESCVLGWPHRSSLTTSTNRCVVSGGCY